MKRRMTRLLGRFVAACCLAAAFHAPATAAAVDPAVLRAESERIDVIAKIRNSVLAIFSATSAAAGGGSGVIITPDGYALTNFHVVQPCGAAMLCGTADGKIYDAVIVGIDPTGDIALIKLLGRNDFPAAVLGDSDAVRVGDATLVLGNPFLLAEDFQPTVTCGIVSGVHRYQYPAGSLLEYADCIQTDASINPGNSGGPMFDDQGRVIGINGRASFEKRGRVNIGAGYAVSINQVKHFLGDLRSGRIVDHATLGATVAWDEDQRVVVSDILDDSDAYRRGLRYGDEIVRFGGRTIDSPNTFKNVLGIFPKDRRVPLSYRRDGKRYEIAVRLDGVHEESQLLELLGDKPRSAGPKPPVPEKRETPPKDSKPKPEPRKHASAPRVLPMPEAVKQHFEARRGYANYFFNRLERDRVWKAFAASGRETSSSQTWQLVGQDQNGTRFTWTLDDRGLAGTAGAAAIEWRAAEELASALEPPGTGGFFPALWLWRRFATEGPQGYGDVVYLGTTPLPGRDGETDVLRGLYRGLEARFYFDPATGRLVAMETFPSPNVDPCEIRFEYAKPSGFAPTALIVRYGDREIMRIHLEGLRADGAKKPETARTGA